MNHVSFGRFTRHAATLLDRRSLVGGLRAALLTAAGITLAVEAKGKKGKACKKRVRLCKSDLRNDICEGNNACINDLNTCCKKACRSTRQAIDCCEDAGWCL